MSINLSVGASGATTGRTDQTIPGDGEIDTAEEATAALTLLPDGSTNTVKVGTREYTRAQLIEIRDRPAAPVAAPAVTASHRLYLDPALGLDIGHFGMDYNTPGGEPANSAFTRYGALLGLDLRYSPPIWDNRFSLALGGRFGFGGFGTADSTTVSTPTGCTPGDFGRGECEPGAGPQTGNAGTTGLIDPRTGSSRGGSGAYLYAGIPLTVAAEVARGDWGNLQLFGGAEYGYTHLFPSGSEGFGFSSLAGFLGVRGSFGGSSTPNGDGLSHGASLEGYGSGGFGDRGHSGGGARLMYRMGVPLTGRPRSVGPTTDEARTHSTEIPGGAEFALGDEAAVRALGGLGADARILGVQLDDHPEDTSAPYTFEAAWMTPGSHTIKIRYRNPGDTEDRIRPVRITVGTPAPVRVPEGGTGEAYGLVLNMPERALRLAPDVVGGVSTPRPIPVGNIQTTATFPEGATYQLYVDGNPVGTAAPLPRDRSTPLTLPATVGDGPHQVEVRVSRPNQAEIRYPARAVAIGPGTATLSAGSITSNPPSGGYYASHPVRIAITSDVATRARVTIGSHTEDVTLVVGANTINMSGLPSTWNTGGAAGRNATNTVRVQPLDAAGALTGTGVDVGTVVTRRAGGHHRATTPRPARPLP